MAGNNPPDYILELTAEEAQFLTDNTNTGILQLMALLQGAMDGIVSDGTAQKVVPMLETMRPILKKLKAQGLKPTGDE